MARRRWPLLSLCLLLPPGAAPAQGAFELSSQNGCPAELGQLRLTVDSYGSFGSSTDIAGDAFFDPPEPRWDEAGTVYESMPFLCVTQAGQTRGSWLENGRAAGLSRAQAQRNANRVTSTFSHGDLDVRLVQTLDCNLLTQCYQFTNRGAQEASVLAVTQYIDERPEVTQ